jgi:tryptophanyl-tRNA synthetase
MTRILSGLKSSGDATLGNYLGAIKRWVELQPTNTPVDEGVAASNEYFFFVPNLHALTVRPEPAVLHRDTLSNAAWLIAAGLDPAKVTLFVQSQVPAHAELAWIFNNYVTMGELGRMTQYKDKVGKSGAEGQLVGMFTYPALMAADTDEVPVGDDQKQHVELARDIAERFNNLYGQTFVVPKAVVPDVAARIMNLQDPSAKMSKSDDDHSGNIMMADSSEVMRGKIKRAVTDSGAEIKASEDKPAITNLLEIFSAVTGDSIEILENRYKGQGYGKFKEDLADAVVEHIEPIQRRHQELMNDNARLLAVLDDGRVKASAIAEAKLSQVKQTLGLL